MFQNAKWLLKAQRPRARCRGTSTSRRATSAARAIPFPQSILTPNRANGAGTAQVLLDPLGDVRLDNLHTFDFRIDRPFRFGSRVAGPGDGDLQPDEHATRCWRINRKQAATNANTVSGIIAPRVMRFGINVRW